MERDKVNTKKVINKLFVCLLIVCFLIGSSGCFRIGGKKNYEKPIVIINDINVPKEEMMLYILQIKTEFEQLGGEDVWGIEDFSGGKTANEVARQGALENLIKVKLLVKNSEDMNITITEEEKEETIKKAKLYYNDIDKEYIEEYGIKEEFVINTFLEYQLANEVTNKITNNYNPTEEEIQGKMMTNEDYAKLVGKNAEDVLTQITVKHIVTKTHSENEQGELSPLSTEQQNKAYKKIQEAYNRAKKGENFDILIEQYSEDELKLTNKGVYDFSKALMTQVYKDALEGVPIGGISKIVNSAFGYHIFKIINKTNPSQEDIEQYNENFVQWEEILMQEYEEALKKEAFNEIYQELKINAEIEINSQEWDKINISNHN